MVQTTRLSTTVSVLLRINDKPPGEVGQVVIAGRSMQHGKSEVAALLRAVADEFDGKEEVPVPESKPNDRTTDKPADEPAEREQRSPRNRQARPRSDR
ncbi:hypothetical protein [Amycolatopsis palatopharyngis]|uniref:hypothetical protein n=1 Tax=Amycolatopsis palatopharyngis TaxID=187982 RepID=UPI000E278713|nr:hypothetical protein [Amycolatopsis palatopharyngis]